MEDEYRYETDVDVTEYADKEAEDYSERATVEQVTNTAVLIDNDYNGVTINDIDGITIISTLNKVKLNASQGFEISKIADGKIIFSVDANTGDGVFNGIVKGSSFVIDPHVNTQGRTESLTIDTWGYYNKDAASALPGAQNNVVMLNSGNVYLQDNTGMAVNTQLKINQTSLSFDSYIGTTPVALQNQDIQFDQSKGIVLGVNNIDDFIIGEMYIRINKPINTTVRIDASSRQIQFAQGGVDKWHIESVSNGDIFKIVETSVSQRLLLNSGTTLPQMELNGDGSFLKMTASNNSFIEHYIGATRYGWFGYGSAGTTTMNMRNEQGDISITPKTTTNKITAVGAFEATTYADFQTGSVNVTPSAANANTAVVVTFPRAFASAPRVFCVANTGAPDQINGCTPSTVSATGFTINLNRTNTTVTTCYWFASLA